MTQGVAFAEHLRRRCRMERLPMNQVREILRLRWLQGLTVREASRALNVSTGVVSKVTNRAARLGLSWDAVQEMADATLDRRLYGAPRGFAAPSGPGRIRSGSPSS